MPVQVQVVGANAALYLGFGLAEGDEPLELVQSGLGEGRREGHGGGGGEICKFHNYSLLVLINKSHRTSNFGNNETDLTKCQRPWHC